jgi:hyperosmotically inducible periplasmic protein
MKHLKRLALLSSVAVALAATNAHAEVASAVTSTAPSTSQASKAERKAASRANRILEKAVLKALAKDKSLDVHDITVRARNGAVTLLGTVPDQSQVDPATQVAQGVAGVTSVTNALKIKAIGQ